MFGEGDFDPMLLEADLLLLRLFDLPGEPLADLDPDRERDFDLDPLFERTEPDFDLDLQEVVPSEDKDRKTLDSSTGRNMWTKHPNDISGNKFLG